MPTFVVISITEESDPKSSQRPTQYMRTNINLYHSYSSSHLNPSFIYRVSKESSCFCLLSLLLKSGVICHLSLLVVSREKLLYTDVHTHSAVHFHIQNNLLRLCIHFLPWVNMLTFCVPMQLDNNAFMSHGEL